MRIRRFSFPVIGFLLLGLVTTLAVTGLAVRVDMAEHPGPSRGDGLDWRHRIFAAADEFPLWYYQIRHRPGATRIVAWPGYTEMYEVFPEHRPMERRRLPWWSQLHGLKFPPPDVPFGVGPDGAMTWPSVWPPHVRVEDARGWPLRAFRCEYRHIVHEEYRWWVIAGVDHGIRIRPETPRPTLYAQGGIEQPLWGGFAIPLRPIWAGILFNTIFFALLWWSPFALKSFVQRSWRRRRGRCANCGYPRGASPVCTECGQPLSAFGGAHPAVAIHRTERRDSRQ